MIILPSALAGSSYHPQIASHSGKRPIQASLRRSHKRTSPIAPAAVRTLPVRQNANQRYSIKRGSHFRIKGLEINNSSFLHSSFRTSLADLQSQNPQHGTTTLAVLLNRIDQICPKSVRQFQ